MRYERRNTDVCKPVLLGAHSRAHGASTLAQKQTASERQKSKANGQVIELNVVMDMGSRRPRVNSDEARRCQKVLVFINVL